MKGDYQENVLVHKESNVIEESDYNDDQVFLILIKEIYLKMWYNLVYN